MSQQLDSNSGVSLPGRRVPPEILQEARRIKDMMLTVHYFAEASWLVAAMEYPLLCSSPAAQRALRETAKIAWQWGAPNLALWLNTDILDNSARVNLSWSDEFPAMQNPTFVPALGVRRS